MRSRNCANPFRKEELKQAAAASVIIAPANTCRPSFSASNSRKLLAAGVPPLTCCNARVFEISGCRALSHRLSATQMAAATIPNIIIRFITVLLQKVVVGEINVETAKTESRGSPFPLPARLADGLDQGSDLKNRLPGLLRPGRPGWDGASGPPRRS